ESEFEGRKPKFEVNVSPSSSAQSKKHDDKTKREDKGKSHVESLTGYRNLSAEFEDFSDKSINEDNVVGNLVPTVGQLSPNSTNTFSTAGPSNAAANPTHGKYLLAKIEAIRLFLAYASFMGFMVYQMDVKSAFLYETIKEEALYGLHQAPRAWYETLANYLLENGFQRGKIDQTLFIKRQKGDILLVQIYVDDIIFGLTNKDLCKAFEKLMKDKFQMSSIGEFTFFLGLQVKQKKDRILISQDKYVAEILRKFGLIDGKSASTPIDTEKPLLKDPDGEDVDVHTYRSMIGSLMYLTLSRPDIMFAVYACARFQMTPKASHLHAVVQSGMESLKRMLHVTNILSAGSLTSQQMVLNSPCLTHIKNWLVQIKRSLSWLVQKQTALGINTPRCDEDRLELIELTVFLLPSDEKVRVEGRAVDLQTSVVVKKVNDITRLQALVDKKKVVITEASIRDALRLDDAEGIECLPNEEIFAELARMGKQVGDLSTHTIKYTSPALTQKVFANMRRVGKGFFGVEMPLFKGMIAEQHVAKGDDDEVHVEDVNAVGVATEGVVSAADDIVPTVNDEPSIPSPTPPTPPPQPSQDQPSTSQVYLTPPQSPQVQPQSPQPQPQPSQDAGLPMDLLQNLMT
nr:putative ribonuclease H-like domain-containing protein [Tanacetum cinerariifolium]